MIVFPNAKINIGLNVIRKRDDGYHDIETIFYPVKLCDIIEILQCPSGSHMPLFRNTGLPIEVPLSKNLCVKAYRLLQNDFKIPDISIHLHKIIPLGAGLGGGSSDAVSTMKLLNNLFSLGISDGRILDYALSLGSDCAFFTENRPVIAKGRGEILERILLNISGLHLIIVKPSFGISTVEAYSEVQPKFPQYSLVESIKQPIDKWKEHIQNDFEKSIFQKYPEIKRIKEELYNMGAVFASMSGSGSAVYGIFNENPEINNQFPGCFFWKGILE